MAPLSPPPDSTSILCIPTRCDTRARARVIVRARVCASSGIMLAVPDDCALVQVRCEATADQQEPHRLTHSRDLVVGAQVRETKEVTHDQRNDGPDRSRC